MLEALKHRIAANIASTGQNASGKTIRSLEVTATGESVMLLGRFPFGTLETGRKPGKVPKGFDAIILQWMKDKGIKARAIPYVRKQSKNWKPKYSQQERGDRSLAGAIAYNIMTKGTLLYRRGGSADVYSNEIPLTLENLKKKLGELFADEINTINLNRA